MKKLNNNKKNIITKIKDNKFLKEDVEDYDHDVYNKKNMNKDLQKALNNIKIHINKLLIENNKLNKKELIQDEKEINSIKNFLLF